MRKMYEEYKAAREEKEKLEFLSCFTKDRRGSVTKIKEPVLPPLDDTNKVHTAKVQNSSATVTPEEMSAMFSDYMKLAKNMVDEQVASELTKFSRNSKYAYVPESGTSTPPVSSAAPDASAAQPLYGMPTGFYAGQTPPPRDLFSRPNTDMVTYSAQPTPINVAYPSSASTS